MIKVCLRFVVRLLFRFRAHNDAVLKTPGPVLLVPNHVGWLDWLLVGVFLEDDWKFVVSAVSAQTSWLHRKIMLNERTFPIDTSSPYAVKRMAEHLQANGRLVLFAEGRLSRTGTLMKLFDGTGFLLHKTEAKVITAYLRGAHRILFSPNREQKKLFPKVTAHFSEVLTPPALTHATTSQARSRLTEWLRDKMLLQQFHTEMAFGPATVPEAILEAARQRPGHAVLEDINGVLKYRRLVLGASLMAGGFEKCLSGEQSRVGVLLPNVNATPVTLLGLWLIGRVPALLNYSSGMATMLACSQLAGLKQIITSKGFLERARLNLEPMAKAGIQFIYVEDVRQKNSRWEKLSALLRVRFNPQATLDRPPTPDSTAVILFTSGSEAMPKGVELSHTNLLTNI